MSIASWATFLSTNNDTYNRPCHAAHTSSGAFRHGCPRLITAVWGYLIEQAASLLIECCLRNRDTIIGKECLL